MFIYGSFIFRALRVLKYYVPKNTYAIPTAFFRCPSVHYHRIGAGDRVDA